MLRAFSDSLFKSVLRFKNGFCLNSNIISNLIILIHNLKFSDVLSFDSEVFVIIGEIKNKCDL